MRRARTAGITLWAGIVFGVACTTGGDGRLIQIVQNDDGCSPASFTAAPSEKLTFEFVNQGTKDKEFEGVEGTQLEEIKVPAGKTRKTNWTAPKTAGAAKFQCYLPGGATTIVTADVK